MLSASKAADWRTRLRRRFLQDAKKQDRRGCKGSQGALARHPAVQMAESLRKTVNAFALFSRSSRSMADAGASCCGLMEAVSSILPFGFPP